MKYIIAYGTLRKSAPWFFELQIKYSNKIKAILTDLRLKGFELYNVIDPESGDKKEVHDFLAGKISNNESEIIVDIIAMHNEIYDYIIKVMDHSDFKVYKMSLNGYICDMFIYTGKTEENLKVESGNFFNNKISKSLVL